LEHILNPDYELFSEKGLKEALLNTTYALIIAFWPGHATIQHRNFNSISCIYGPKDLQDLSLIIFGDKLLKDYEIIENEMIQLPN